MQHDPRSRQIFFYVILILTGLLALFVLHDFLTVIVLSFIYAFAIRPLFKIFHRLLKSAHLASLVTLLISFVIIFIPIYFTINLFVMEALSFRKTVAIDSTSFAQVVEDEVRTVYVLLRDIPFANNFINPNNISQTIEKSADSASSFLVSKAVAIGSSSASLLTGFFIFLFLVYFITPSLSKIRQYVEQLSPLDNNIDKLYIDRAIAMTSSVVKGTFIVALVQGMLGGVFIWLAGVDYVLTLTLAMIISSVIPVVGTGIVSIPISILLFVSGQTGPAMIVLLGQLIVISNIDNILRAELVSRDASLHPAIMLISIFGGLSVFGVAGLIYGPVIMILFITSLEIYQKHIKY